MQRKKSRLPMAYPVVLIALLVVNFAIQATGADSVNDWPQWRFDAQRRAVSPMALSESLQLQWTLTLPAPSRAWAPQGDHFDKLDFDESYSPIVLGRTMLVASMVQDSLTAFDTRTGKEQWRFYADGPMRLAPAAWQGRVYAVSDDGFLYCLDAESGEELWRFRGGPDNRRLLGNRRLINMWAARGGPVVYEGAVYFAASLWPMMGVFIHALDAETGEPVWSNTGSGSHYNLHQHGGAYAFGGVAPQGYLAATNEMLMVSGGRTVPAAYDLATGAFKFFEQASGTVGKGAGGYRVGVQGNWYYNHGMVYSMADGAQFAALDAEVLTDEAVYVVAGDEDSGYRVEAYATDPDADPSVEIENRLERGALNNRYSHKLLWEAAIDAPVTRLHLLADNRLYGSGKDGFVAAIDLPRDEGTARVVWTDRVDGDVWEMLAADDRLFVATQSGSIYCFGADSVSAPAVIVTYDSDAVEPPSPEAMRRGADLLARSEVDGGYVVLFGAGTDYLAETLVRQQDVHVVVVEPDAGVVADMRRRYSDLDLYGRRLAFHEGDARTFDLPSYLAELIIVEDMDALGDLDIAVVKRLFGPLRPYGGLAFLPLDEDAHETLASLAAEADLANASVERIAGNSLLGRPGPLPGAGQWTHQYADSSNTSYSPEQLAKAPLGVLWYGGPSNEHILPRHGQGPIPHVVKGRVFLPGVDTMSARDVYTGRELWVREFPGIGHPFTNLELEEKYWNGEAVYMSNLPGANFIGSFYASAPDSLYVRYQGEIVRLDPATGEQLAAFSVAPNGGNNNYSDYGHISLWEDLLVTSAEPHYFDDEPIGDMNWNATSSNTLVVRDRHTGAELWSREAIIGFRHNTIISGGGKLFVVDGQSEEAMALLSRRGMTTETAPRLLAFDVRTGEEIWSTDDDVFATFLLYSEEHDLLVQSGRHGGKRVLPDEPNRSLCAHHGRDGSVAWERTTRYAGPVSLHNTRIIPGRPGPAVDLLTGELAERAHPLTGETVSWAYHRTYGCGTMNTSEHLIAFRSGAAGYTDLAGDGGTGNLSGFRSGCTNNLIAADGVLNAPDYTRTCTCAYQNQTSLALIHMPDVEMWTYNQITRGSESITQAGVNLGAPGNHVSDSGVLWVEYPRVGGPAPEFPVHITPDDSEPFRIHTSLISDTDGALPWVAGSGLTGLHTLEVELADEDTVKTEAYTVRLHFVEPENIAPGERIFDVYVQGDLVLEALDVVAEAGGSRRGIMREFKEVSARNTLRIDLRPVEGSRHAAVLCGAEFVSASAATRLADALLAR